MPKRFKPFGELGKQEKKKEKNNPKPWNTAGHKQD